MKLENFAKPQRSRHLLHWLGLAAAFTFIGLVIVLWS